MGSRGEAGGEPRCFLFLGLPREASVSLSQATDTSVQEEGEAGTWERRGQTAFSRNRGTMPRATIL